VLRPRTRLREQSLELRSHVAREGHLSSDAPPDRPPCRPSTHVLCSRLSDTPT
jgi:hypothetical protein